jgi:hypothetical protein
VRSRSQIRRFENVRGIDGLPDSGHSRRAAVGRQLSVNKHFIHLTDQLGRTIPDLRKKVEHGPDRRSEGETSEEVLHYELHELMT